MAAKKRSKPAKRPPIKPPTARERARTLAKRRATTLLERGKTTKAARARREAALRASASADSAADAPAPSSSPTAAPLPKLSNEVVHLASAAKTGAGRPSIIDIPASRAVFLATLAGGNTVDDSAWAAGYHPRTLYGVLARGRRAARAARRGHVLGEREQEYAIFFQEASQALIGAKTLLVTRLHNASRDDWRAALAILRARYSKEWGDGRAHRGGDDDAGETFEPKRLPVPKMVERATTHGNGNGHRPNLEEVAEVLHVAGGNGNGNGHAPDAEE